MLQERRHTCQVKRPSSMTLGQIFLFPFSYNSLGHSHLLFSDHRYFTTGYGYSPAQAPARGQDKGDFAMATSTIVLSLPSLS